MTSMSEFRRQKELEEVSCLILLHACVRSVWSSSSSNI